MTDFANSASVSNAVRRQHRVLTEGEKLSVTHIKNMGLGLIRAVDAGVPEGREQSIARERIEEAVMWAVKGLTA